MAAKLHLVKLCVGVDSVTHLQGYIDATCDAMRAAGQAPATSHVTRMWPKREAELLQGGSLFWVIKGVIQARQRIVALEERIGGDGIRRCEIVMDPELIRTQSAPRRAFQGWRYLNPEDAPADLSGGRTVQDDVPPELQAALADLGVL